jgi:hypothetical protein
VFGETFPKGTEFPASPDILKVFGQGITELIFGHEIVATDRH